MTEPSTKEAKETTKDCKPPAQVKRPPPVHQQDGSCCRCMVQYVTFVLVLFGLTFLYLRRFQYNDHFLSVDGEGELSLRHFIGDLNTVLCEKYQLSAWQSLDFYLTSGEAKLDKVNTETVKRTENHLYPDSPILDNSFYLLEGSVININACRVHERSVPTSDSVDLVIFKGEDSWKNFKSGDCVDCAIGNTSLPLDSDCEDNREFLMTYTVRGRESYRVAILNRREGSSTFSIPLRATLNINKTIFDISDAKKVCSDAKCTIPLQYGQDVDIVAQFGKDVFITTHCEFRFMFCIGIFVILPSCLLILGFTCCAVITKSERKKKRNRKVKATLQTEDVHVKDTCSLVKNELPPANDCTNSLV